ncbi:MAG TPA: hypothetical protein VMW56_02565 [Candidatus Margulisiibacteriota bacterium]|nr:hypothetical protein [Candidatus Margulisiibacteriota bacterium]
MSNSHALNSVIGYERSAARIASILGAASPSPSTAMVPSKKQYSLKAYLDELKATAPDDVKDGLGTAAGAAAGYLFVKKHRFLGAIAGASLGRNVPALLDPEQRHLALRNLGITSAGLIGSLTVPKHPVIGFVLGWLAGGAATYAAGLK